MGIEEITALAAVNPDKFYVENLWNWDGTPRNGDFEFVGKNMNQRLILGSNGC